MNKNRMEAFSDGVIAIIITIMVLELKAPHGADLSTLRSIIPVFLSYVLSFIYVGIYWNNHHHLLHAVKHVNGRVLWANLHLLFWLSLVPFVTGWMGENHFAEGPVALYGMIMLFAGCAYLLLTRALIAADGTQSTLAKAVGKECKGKSSLTIYAAATLLAFINSWIAVALYISVAIIWFIPDQRIEKMMTNRNET